MPRKPKVTTAKLDDLFRNIMRRTDRLGVHRAKCHACGRGHPEVNLQTAHGFSRRYRGTRWTEELNFCLCAGCHTKYTYDPIGWDDYLKRVWGEEKYWQFRRQAQAITKIDKQELYESLRARLKEIHDEFCGSNVRGLED